MQYFVKSVLTYLKKKLKINNIMTKKSKKFFLTL